MKVVHVVAAAG